MGAGLRVVGEIVDGCEGRRGVVGIAVGLVERGQMCVHPWHGRSVGVVVVPEGQGEVVKVKVMVMVKVKVIMAMVVVMVVVSEELGEDALVEVEVPAMEGEEEPGAMDLEGLL